MFHMAVKVQMSFYLQALSLLLVVHHGGSRKGRAIIPGTETQPTDPMFVFVPASHQNGHNTLSANEGETKKKKIMSEPRFELGAFCPCFSSERPNTLSANEGEKKRIMSEPRFELGTFSV
jgi:hypothetical protein